MTPAFDLVVIGGGIHGAAVARDAAGRGLKVLLAESRDYGGATSSASSKLIHGGLRYLEQGHIGLVRKSLAEREVMLRLAPHLVRPLRFLVPLRRGRSRAMWRMRLGLALYDWLGSRRSLPASGRLDQAKWPSLAALRRDGLLGVLHYGDCWVDDSRLVLETLLDARARGADIANRREVIAVEACETGFAVTLAECGLRRRVQARVLVNATGPWANRSLERLGLDGPRLPLRLVRGSHIVLPCPRPGESDAFTLQNDDGRVVFVLPWLERFRLVGTTDVEYCGEPGDAQCSEEECHYLIDCYRRYFDHEVSPADVLWRYAGVRPLIDSGASLAHRLSRDSALLVDRQGGGACLSVYGGKLTTHRMLAEQAMDEIARLGIRLGPRWTAAAPLHGGALGRPQLDALAEQGPPDVPQDTCRRWTATYGSETTALYERVRKCPALGRPIALGIPEAELDYAAEVEDARSAEDFLFRRTKLFLTLDAPGRRAIERWFEAGGARRAASG